MCYNINMKLPFEYIESLKDVTNLNIEKLKKSFDNDAIVGVRFNPKKLPFVELNAKNIENFMKNNEIFANFSQIPWCKEGFLVDGDARLGKNIFHELGLYYLQEPSAMSPVEFLNIEPNDVVLDLCAAPGGKSTQIASKLNGGFLIANEIVSQRAKVLCENVQRLGLDNVIVTNHSPKELENKFENYFDKILVDAPCSGEGMFRKNNNAINEWNINSPIQCTVRQKEIVKSAYKMLKPNGIMVYSTCTFSLQENEEIIKFLLDEFDDLEILPVEHEKYNFENGIDIDKTGRLTNCARLYPYNLNGEGHFFAVIHKKGNKFFESRNQNNFYIDTFNIDKIKVKHKNFERYNNSKSIQKIKIFEEFFSRYSKIKFKNYCLIGDYLYANCPIDIDKLKVLNASLFLGEFKKETFVPSLHLSHFLNADDFDQIQNLSLDETKKYLEGLELSTNHKDGWVLLLCNNLPISFGKCVNGKIKNHYPKNLRKKL